MADFRGEWYGLGAIDFSQGTPAIVGGYGIPAIGHGGVGPPIAVMLVKRPHRGIDLRAPDSPPDPRAPVSSIRRVRRSDVLGGLIHEYELVA